jgi:SPASM domain peptide maturase of grasp-with-spasm system
MTSTLRSTATHFVLYSCCIPVKGDQRSLICDMQRRSFRFIPNALFEMLTAHDRLPVDHLYELYGRENKDDIDEYFNCLVKEEIGFFTDEPERFPKPELTHQDFSLVNNAIIDLDEDSAYDVRKVILQLDELFCQALQIRFYGAIGVDRVCGILEHLEGTGFHSVDLVIANGGSLPHAGNKMIIKRYPRVQSMLLFNYKVNRTSCINQGKMINYLKDDIASVADCGCISPYYFSPNLKHVSEAVGFNTCLNRKISIDARGKIRNCPSMSSDYGDSDTEDILNILKLRSFQKYWSINKDKIEVCKDCEFRYICSDCRAFIRDEKNILSKPSKCNYDPYTAKWI